MPNILIGEIGTVGEHYFTATVVKRMLQIAPESYTFYVLTSPDNQLLPRDARVVHYQTTLDLGKMMEQTFCSNSGVLQTIGELAKLTPWISLDVNTALRTVLRRHQFDAIWLTGLMHLFAYPVWQQHRRQIPVGKLDPYLICDPRPGVREHASHLLTPRAGWAGQVQNRIVHTLLDKILGVIARHASQIALRNRLISAMPRAYHPYYGELGSIYATSFDNPDAQMLRPTVYRCPALVGATATDGTAERRIVAQASAAQRVLLLHTLGSMTALVGAKGRTRMLTMLLAAARRRPELQMVMIMPAAYPELPEGVHGEHANLEIVATYLDIPLLISAAKAAGVADACVVSHGGIGTTLLSRCLGLPHLATPILSEQHYNAHLAAARDYRVPIIPFARLTPDRFEAALDALLAQARQLGGAWGTPEHMERLEQFSGGASRTIAATMLALTEQTLGRPPLPLTPLSAPAAAGVRDYELEVVGDGLAR